MIQICEMARSATVGGLSALYLFGLLHASTWLQAVSGHSVMMPKGQNKVSAGGTLCCHDELGLGRIVG